MLALFLGALALLPMMLIICTSFLKITMVLQLTRNAMGVQQVPPTMALNGIALAATLFIMAPVFSDAPRNSASIIGFSGPISIGITCSHPRRSPRPAAYG